MASTASTRVVQRRRPRCAVTVEPAAVIGHRQPAWPATGLDRPHRARPAGPLDGRNRADATLRPQKTDVPLRPTRPACAGPDRQAVPPLPGRGALAVALPHNLTADHSPPYLPRSSARTPRPRSCP